MGKRITSYWNFILPDLEKLLGSARAKDQELTQRHKDIAHSVQLMYEEAFFHLLNKLHKKYKIDNSQFLVAVNEFSCKWKRAFKNSF